MHALAIVVLLATTSWRSKPELVELIDQIAADAIHDGPKAGMSIAVVYRGETILAKGYGFSNLELETPATADTIYHIDSITKHLTSAAILRLVEQKKITLDDPVTNYGSLPPVWSRVRLRNLLNHTSGSVSYTSLPNWGPQERLDISHEEILGLIGDKPFLFVPGTKWRYNNSGFYLAGMVIEKATGQSYGDAMRQLIFDPANMRSTSVCGFRPVIKNRATGYETVRGAFVNAEPMSWAAPFAGGAVCSTVGDLVRFESALDGRTRQMMTAPTPMPNGVNIDYGLGTRLGSIGGYRMFGHTGTGGGFNNALLRIPDVDLTIVVLGNSDGGRVSSLRVAGRIARLMLGVADEASREVAIPANEIRAYEGSFESEEGAVDNVVTEGHVSFRNKGSNDPLTPLRYIGSSTFMLAPDVDVKMIVQDGKATWGMVYIDGLLMDAVYRCCS